MVGTYYVYPLTNANHAILYTGVTNDLAWRMMEHVAGTHQSFTKAYNVLKLVYFETYSDINAAIAREKQLRAGSRAKKLALMNEANPTREELAA